MFTFEEFKQLNSSKWGSRWSDKEMEKNYVIAIQVANNYSQRAKDRRHCRVRGRFSCVLRRKHRGEPVRIRAEGVYMRKRSLFHDRQIFPNKWRRFP